MSEKEQTHIFASVAPYRKVHALAHGLKRGEQESIVHAARLMAPSVLMLEKMTGRPSLSLAIRAIIPSTET
jgi:hypothetical protein